MRLTKLEEYGLRCIRQLAKVNGNAPCSIPEISKNEGLSIDYVTKLLSALRRSGFVKSIRGINGGYILTRKPEEITLSDILRALGGQLLDKNMCSHFAGNEKYCNYLNNCGIKPVWNIINQYLNDLLTKLTLADISDDAPIAVKKLKTKLLEYTNINK
jgi:Rrf2 family protein